LYTTGSRSILRAVSYWLVLGSIVLFDSASTAPSRFDVRAQNEPVRAVLLRVAKQSGASIVIGQGVAGLVTVSLRNVTVGQSLDAILAPLGDRYRMHRGVVEVFAMPGSSPERAESLRSSTVVLQVTNVTSKRAVAILSPLFPQVAIGEDSHANTILATGSPADLQSVKTVLQGIDATNPMLPTTAAVPLSNLNATTAVQQLHVAFPQARFGVVNRRQILVTALPADLVQIKSALSALDAPGPPRPYPGLRRLFGSRSGGPSISRDLSRLRWACEPRSQAVQSSFPGRRNR